ncbi:MAG: DUF167 domain-containing protein [Phycisphaerales bacterium]
MAILVPDDSGGFRLAIKVVPGARRDQIAGLLGERLKVRVSAPPEGGKANKAVCRLIAGAIGVAARDVDVIAGHGSPEKSLRIRNAGEQAIRTGLSLDV